MEKVFLTGWTGFVGSIVKERLGDCAVLYETKSRNPSVDELYNQLKESSVVIHIAGGGGPKSCKERPRESMINNIIFTQHLVEASKKAKIKQFIYASTLCVYNTFEERENPLTEDMGPKPDEAYGSLKWGCEEIVKTLPYTILRLSGVYGISPNNMNKGGFVNAIIRKSKETGKIKVSSSTLKIDIVNIQDVANAFILAIDNPDAINETFNIGSGKAISLVEAANLVKDNANYPIEIEVDEQPGYVTRWSDITKSQDRLKWSPKISLVEGIKELLK